MKTILLQASPAAQSSIFLVGMLGVVGYMFWSQHRNRKKAQNFRESLKKGQEVVTTGGILGKITEVKDDVVVLEIARSTSIKVEKTSIAGTSDKKS